MAETVRTDAEILALWADNSTNAISAQDVRDGYATLRGATGSDAEETASFTLALSHLGKVVLCNHAATPIVITIPPNSSVAFPVNAVLTFIQWGAADVTFSDGGASPPAITLRKPASAAAQISEQNAVAQLWQQDTDVWVLLGSLAAAA